MKSRIVVLALTALLVTSCTKSAEPSASLPDETSTTTIEAAPSPADATTTTSSSNSTTIASLPSSVKYSLSRVGESKDAVDLTERSSSDSFFYVVSRAGTIQKWSTQNQQPQIVLDVSALITSEGERGLLGLAFRRVNSQWFAYINHTDRDGNTQIAEYTVNSDGTFNDASRRAVMSIEQPYANHNGGGLAIGPDNMLYIGMGDGGAAGDPERRARKLNTLLGKILRINPAATTTAAYTIPADNPFVGTPDARGEIWSIGLRNPWRFSFDENDNLWIADVGQNKWEEINMVRRTPQTLAGKGVDFGWSAFEGTHRFNDDEQADASQMPVFEYSHSDSNCSVSGSAVATTQNMPLRRGWYFFGDYCSGRVTALHIDADGKVRTESVTTKAGNITGLRSISKGVYLLTLNGTISRIAAAKP